MEAPLPRLPLEIWAIIADFLLHSFNYVGFAAVSVDCNRVVRRAICNISSEVVQVYYGTDMCENIECTVGGLLVSVKLSHVHGFYDIGIHPYDGAFDYLVYSRQCDNWQCLGSGSYDKGRKSKITRIIPNTLALQRGGDVLALISPPPERVFMDLFFYVCTPAYAQVYTRPHPNTGKK